MFIRTQCVCVFVCWKMSMYVICLQNIILNFQHTLYCYMKARTHIDWAKKILQYVWRKFINREELILSNNAVTKSIADPSRGTPFCIKLYLYIHFVECLVIYVEECFFLCSRIPTSPSQVQVARQLLLLGKMLRVCIVFEKV